MVSVSTVTHGRFKPIAEDQSRPSSCRMVGLPKTERTVLALSSWSRTLLSWMKAMGLGCQNDEGALNPRPKILAVQVFWADEEVFLTNQISFHDHWLQVACPSIGYRLVRL